MYKIIIVENHSMPEIPQPMSGMFKHACSKAQQDKANYNVDCPKFALGS